MVFSDFVEAKRSRYGLWGWVLRCWQGLECPWIGFFFLQQSASWAGMPVGKCLFNTEQSRWGLPCTCSFLKAYFPNGKTHYLGECIGNMFYFAGALLSREVPWLAGSRSSDGAVHDSWGFPKWHGFLVGGDWNMAGLWLSIQLGMECHHPNWRKIHHFFQRGRGQPPTRYSNFRWYLYIYNYITIVSIGIGWNHQFLLQLDDSPLDVFFSCAWEARW